MLANAAWPALYEVASNQLVYLACVLAGLIIEWLVVRAMLSESIAKPMRATIVANLISVAVGALFVSLLLGFVRNGILDFSTNGVTLELAAAYGSFVVGAACINVLLEGAALRLIFKARFTLKSFGWFWAANLASVLLAIVGTLIPVPVR